MSIEKPQCNQVVILAAGRGRRMKDLTDGTPKPLLKVDGKNLLEHKFDALPDEIKEIVIVIGYLGDQIKDYFGDSHNGRKITYVEQGELDGTGGALMCAKDVLNERFLVLNGDDVYPTKDIEKMLKYPWAIGVKHFRTEMCGGLVVVDEHGMLKDIVEGKHADGGFVNMGIYVLQKSFFDYPLTPKAEGSDEYGLPQQLMLAAKDVQVHVYTVESTGWRQYSCPEDLENKKPA